MNFTSIKDMPATKLILGFSSLSTDSWHNLLMTLKFLVYHKSAGLVKGSMTAIRRLGLANDCWAILSIRSVISSSTAFMTFSSFTDSSVVPVATVVFVEIASLIVSHRIFSRL